MLFSYKIVYKITTGYTPYQLVYVLHPLMPIEYIMPIVVGHQRDYTSVRVLTSKISKLGSYKRLVCKLQKLMVFNSGIEHYGISKKIQNCSSILVIMFCGFQRKISHT
jgi:hypothetical protein